MAAKKAYPMLTDDGIRRFMIESDAAYPSDAASYEIADQRKFYNALCARFSTPHPPGIVTQDATVAGSAGPVPIRIYRPQATHEPPVGLYLHGGGFVLGGLDSHDSICAEIAEQAGIAVIAVEYRLAPEHPFPAAFDDCRAVLDAIAELARDHAFDAARLIVAGDSAGANLTAALCLHARDNAGPAISGQILIYPSLHGDTATGSYIEHAHAPGLTTADVDYYREVYIGSGGHPDHHSKFASPLRETDYRGLPPAFIVAAEWDPLRDDAFVYAERLRNAGVPAAVRHEPLLVHAFLRARHMSAPAAHSFAAITAAAHSLAFQARIAPGKEQGIADADHQPVSPPR